MSKSYSFLNFSGQVMSANQQSARCNFDFDILMLYYEVFIMVDLWSSTSNKIYIKAIADIVYEYTG